MRFTSACMFGVRTALGIFTTARGHVTCSQLFSAHAQAEQTCICPGINLDGISNSRGWFQAIIPHLTYMSPYSPKKAKKPSILYAFFYLSTLAILYLNSMLAVGNSDLSHLTLSMVFIRCFGDGPWTVDSVFELRCLKVRCHLA